MAPDRSSEVVDRNVGDIPAALDGIEVADFRRPDEVVDPADRVQAARHAVKSHFDSQADVRTEGHRGLEFEAVPAAAPVPASRQPRDASLQSGWPRPLRWAAGTVAGLLGLGAVGMVWRAGDVNNTPAVPPEAGAQPGADYVPITPDQVVAEASRAAIAEQATEVARATSTTTTVALSRPPASTLAAKPAEVEQAPQRRTISGAEKDRMVVDSGFAGLANFSLEEVSRIKSSYGDVVIVSLQGAESFVDRNQLQTAYTYLDKVAAERRGYSYKLTLEDKSVLEVRYHINPSGAQTRYVIETPAGMDLRQIDNRLGISGLDEISGVHDPGKSASFVGVTVVRPIADAGRKVMVPMVGAAHGSLAVTLDSDFVAQVRSQRPGLARVNFRQVKELDVERQLVNLREVMQDIEANRRAYAMTAAYFDLAEADYGSQLTESRYTPLEPTFRLQMLPVSSPEYAELQKAI